MFEILSQAQQTITTVPLDPKEMTALIQQINNMYQGSFSLFINKISCFISIISILFAVIFLIFYFVSKSDLRETKEKINSMLNDYEILKKEKNEIENNLNIIKNNTSSLTQIIAEEHKLFNKTNMYFAISIADKEAEKEEQAKNYPSLIYTHCRIVSSCVSAIKLRPTHMIEQMEAKHKEIDKVFFLKLTKSLQTIYSGFEKFISYIENDKNTNYSYSPYDLSIKHIKEMLDVLRSSGLSLTEITSQIGKIEMLISVKFQKNNN